MILVTIAIMFFGGVGLFLFGMKIITNAIEMLSKEKLRAVFNKVSNTPVKSFFLGTISTALLQSSSAVTVMVVSFVDAGVLSIYAAAGVILGSNIGTTVTSVLVAFSQFSFMTEINSMVVVYFICAVVCLPLMFAKRKRVKAMLEVLMGFSVLMIGMETMTNAMQPISQIPQIKQFLVLFNNPFFCIIAGFLITAVIQSSSAAVGILQALAAAGCVSYYMAIPIIMGQNIGTCVTALIAGIGKKSNAKIASLMNLYFNIIASIVVFVFLYGGNLIFDFQFLNNYANSAGIAFVHVGFNVISVFVVLPFIKPIIHKVNF